MSENIASTLVYARRSSAPSWTPFTFRCSLEQHRQCETLPHLDPYAARTPKQQQLGNQPAKAKQCHVYPMRVRASS